MHSVAIDSKKKLEHNNYIFRHLTFIILIAIFQSKTPSLWLCYMRTYWKVFLYGAILKLLGDLAALVGPISITRIVEYIELELSASSLLTSAEHPAKLSNTINVTNATAPITHTNMTSALNEAIKTGSNSNYDVPLSAAEYRMSSELTGTVQMMSTMLINESTEIYYPTWTEFVANGWIMALLVLFATLAQGSFSQASTHIVNILGIRLRSSLQSLVYRKTLLISSSCFAFQNGASADENGGSSGGGSGGSSGGRGGGGSSSTLLNDNENSNGSVSIDAHESFYANNEVDDNNATVNSVNGVHAVDDKTKADSNDTLNKSAEPSFYEQTAIDTGTITNLMSEDALNVMSFFWIANYVWAIPLKVSDVYFVYVFN